MVPRENLEESVVRTGRDLPVSRPYISCKFKKSGKLLMNISGEPGLFTS